MSSYGIRVTGFGGLEGALRHHRAEPSAELLDELASWVPATPGASRRSPRASARTRTLAFALVTAVTVVLFAAFGGAGYALSGIGSVAVSTGDAIVTLFSQREESDSGQKASDRTSRGQQFGTRVVVCHSLSPGRAVSLRVSQSNLQASLARGDSVGPCL